MEFPDQSVSDKKKNANGKMWYKEHIDFAEDLINSTSSHYRRIDNLYTEYNGKYAKKRFNEFVERYKSGDDNISKTKFIDYKLAQGKIERMVGELLKKPLKPLVLTVNKHAVHKKLDAMALNLAMSEAGPEIEKLRGQFGTEVMGGLPVVDKQDKEFKEKINPKSQNEKFMTLVLQEQIKRLGIKEFAAMTLRDSCIVSECHGNPEILPNKKLRSNRIHPKDSIFQEIESDEFITRSAITGYREEFTMSEIMQRFRPSKSRIDDLKALEGQDERWSDNHIKYVEKRENRLIIWSTKVSWFGSKKIREKFIPGKNNMFIPYYKKILSEEYYEKNKTKINDEVKAGKYQIREGYLLTIYTCRRIGRDWYLEMEEQPYIIRRDDDEFSLMYNQTGLLLQSVDGIRLSLQEKLQDLNDMYNIIMWQIRREIGKYKGSVLVIDEAFFKESTNLNDIMYDIAEEGIIRFNSNAEENQSNRYMESTGGVQSQQIGASDSMSGLLQLKADIMMMVDRISGINESREGDIPATQTATGAMQALNASRTITTPISYYHTRFMENYLTRIMELTKYAIGYLGDDSFDQIIGEDGVSLFKKTKDVHLDDYGVYLADPNRETELREKMTQYGMAAVNAGEIKLHDVMKAERAETLHDATAILERGFEKIEEFQKEQAQADRDSQQQNVQAQQQGITEDREDRQQHEKEIVILEGQVKAGQTNMEAKNAQELQNGATQ